MLDGGTQVSNGGVSSRHPAYPAEMTLTISGNTSEYNVLTAATSAGYAAATDTTNITVVINSGVTVSGSSSYAMRTGALNADSNLTVDNSGDIDGYTGATGATSSSYSGTGGTGSVGGDAVYWETATGGSGTYVINNLSGANVRSGGGGGGGGGGPGRRRTRHSGGKGGDYCGAPNYDGSSGAAGSDGGFGASGSSGASGSFGGGSSLCVLNAVGSGGSGASAGYALRKNSRTVTLNNSGTVTGTVG